MNMIRPFKKPWQMGHKRRTMQPIHPEDELIPLYVRILLLILFGGYACYALGIRSIRDSFGVDPSFSSPGDMAQKCIALFLFLSVLFIVIRGKRIWKRCVVVVASKLLYNFLQNGKTDFIQCADPLRIPPFISDHTKGSSKSVNVNGSMFQLSLWSASLIVRLIDKAACTSSASYGFKP